jgi:hypothetical protein
MGYLDNSTVTVDAILTLKGRELLAKGNNAFNITQFALGDDEIDYSLWNTDHPLGTDYYGIIIENMPITEAIPDETQGLRSKLITLPKSTTNIPVVNVAGAKTFTFDGSSGQSWKITPSTTLQGANAIYGYTAVLSDSSVATISVTQPLTSVAGAPTVSSYVGDSVQSVAVQGFEFQINPKLNYIEDKTATITIFGNETGGGVTLTFTVKKASSF